MVLRNQRNHEEFASEISKFPITRKIPSLIKSNNHTLFLTCQLRTNRFVTIVDESLDLVSGPVGIHRIIEILLRNEFSIDGNLKFPGPGRRFFLNEWTNDTGDMINVRIELFRDKMLVELVLNFLQVTFFERRNRKQFLNKEVLSNPRLVNTGMDSLLQRPRQRKFTPGMVQVPGGKSESSGNFDH